MLCVIVLIINNDLHATLEFNSGFISDFTILLN